MRRADAACAHMHSPDGSTFLREMKSRPPSWNYGVIGLLESLLPSIDAYLLEEHSYKISSRSDLKRRSLRLFEEVTHSPQQEQERQEEKNNKMSTE